MGTSGARLKGISLARSVQNRRHRYLSTERDWPRLGSVGSFLFIVLGTRATSVVRRELLLGDPWGVYAGKGPLAGIRTMKDYSGWDRSDGGGALAQLS